MNVRLPSQRVLAILVLLSLALMTLLSSIGNSPEIGISDLSKLDGGETVVIIGVIVDAWSSDSGSTSLILSDLEAQSTAKVVCASSALNSRQDFHVGDEARAVGELEIAGGRPTIWTTEERVTVLRISRNVITVGSLGQAWELLIADRFETRGVLVPASDGIYRLVDVDSGSSIALRVDQTDVTKYVQRAVVVDATLRQDTRTMNLVLEVHSIFTSL